MNNDIQFLDIELFRKRMYSKPDVGDFTNDELDELVAELNAQEEVVATADQHAKEVITRCSNTAALTQKKSDAPTNCSTYPPLPIDLSGVTHESLASRSIELASQFRRNRDYQTIREEFVKTSLALNQFGLLAPVFRDQPRLPYQRSQWKAYTSLLIDQIVIDCHWLHCRGELVQPRWPELKAMFASAGGFDCDAIANQLAAKGWSCDFRVQELIYVNNRQQTQLMQLRSQVMKKRFRALIEGEREIDCDGRSSRTKAKVSPVRMAINNWADGNHRVRGHEDMYESIWVAMNLLGPKAKHKEIADLAALRCGVKPLNPRTVADKITVLQKVLTEAGI